MKNIKNKTKSAGKGAECFKKISAVARSLSQISVP
jgi:hypothetical protein